VSGSARSASSLGVLLAAAACIASAAVGSPETGAPRRPLERDSTGSNWILASPSDTVVAGGVWTPARPIVAIEGLPIREVLIEPHEIFDPVPRGRFSWVYEFANRAHMRTRASTIRQQLLFAPGDRWNAERAAESARQLRSLDFLTPESIRAVPRGGSVNVRVITRDAWTTSPEFNLESSGGQRFGSVAFTERNLFGLGKSVSVAFRNEPAGKSRSFSLRDPAVLGSRLQLQFDAGTGSAGATNSAAIGLPFYAEDVPRAFGVSWSRSTSVTRLYSQGEVAADFDERMEQTELHWGRGTRRDGTIVRWIGSFLFKDRRMGPSRLEPGAPADFEGGEDNLKVRRLAGELRLWHPRFVEKIGIDRMNGIEDFDLGATAAIKLGFSPRFLGGSADEGYSRFELGAGTETPLGFGLLRASIDSRLRWTPLEIVRRLDARWIVQAPLAQTLVFNAHGIGGERVPRDFQVSTGGLEGLRAYPVHALSGRRLWRFNAEDRWTVGHEYWQLVTLGAAAFYDAARAWGPGAGGTDWHHDVGVGLRVALPHSSQNRVMRLDVAFPMSPTRDGNREPVFSFGSSQAF
jgi:hypothetical protein